MPAPSTGRDLHVDTPLSNIVVNRRPEGFIADGLLPITTVGKQSNMYYKFNRGEWYRHESGITLRAPATEAKKVHMSVASDNYYAPNYALATDWPVEDEVNADEVLQWRRSQALYLTDRLLMDYEMRIADLAVNTSNVGTVTFVASSWTDQSNSTPLTDLLQEKENFRQRTGSLPNIVIIPEGVLVNLRLNSQLRDILFGDRGGVVTADMIAGLLGVGKVLTPAVQVNTAVEAVDPTADPVLSDVWDSGNGDVWLGKINTLEGMHTDTWANAFRWSNPLLGTPFAVQAYPYDVKKKAFGVEVGYYQDEKIVSSDLMVRVTSLS